MRQNETLQTHDLIKYFLKNMPKSSLVCCTVCRFSVTVDLTTFIEIGSFPLISDCNLSNCGTIFLIFSALPPYSGSHNTINFARITSEKLYNGFWSKTSAAVTTCVLPRVVYTISPTSSRFLTFASSLTISFTDMNCCKILRSSIWILALFLLFIDSSFLKILAMSLRLTISKSVIWFETVEVAEDEDMMTNLL